MNLNRLELTRISVAVAMVRSVRYLNRANSMAVCNERVEIIKESQVITIDRQHCSKAGKMKMKT